MFTGTVRICVVCKRGKLRNENEKINFEFQKHKILRVSEGARSLGLRVSRLASRLLLLIRLGSSTASAALIVSLLFRAAASVVITTTAAARARPAITCRNRDVSELKHFHLRLTLREEKQPASYLPAATAVSLSGVVPRS